MKTRYTLDQLRARAVRTERRNRARVRAIARASLPWSPEARRGLGYALHTAMLSPSFHAALAAVRAELRLDAWSAALAIRSPARRRSREPLESWLARRALEGMREGLTRYLQERAR
jgi:hypothetical protein